MPERTAVQPEGGREQKSPRDERGAHPEGVTDRPDCRPSGPLSDCVRLVRDRHDGRTNRRLRDALIEPAREERHRERATFVRSIARRASQNIPARPKMTTLPINTTLSVNRILVTVSCPACSSRRFAGRATKIDSKSEDA